MTTGWAERTPAQASAEIQSADQMADQRQAELGRQLAEPGAGVGRPGVGRAPRSGAGRAAGRLAAAGRPGRLLPGGHRHHRPRAGDRPCTLRAARRGRDVPRVGAGPPAARRGGLAEGDGPGRARGGRGRARPGHRPGPGRRPARDRPAAGRVGRRPGPRSHCRRRPGRRGAGRGRGARPRTPPRTLAASPSPTQRGGNGPRPTPGRRPGPRRPSASSVPAAWPSGSRSPTLRWPPLRP